MKKLFFFVFISISFYSSCFANNYTEDNGAYWYMKALESLPERKNSPKFAPNTYVPKDSDTVPDFNQDILNNYIEFIKKAKSQEKCFFYVLPKYIDDEKMVLPDKNPYYIYQRLKTASDLAWYAISIDKPEYASLIWFSILEMSLKFSENNAIIVRIQCGGIPLTNALSNLSKYFDNGASEEFKKPFIDFMKAWPSSIFDLNDVKKVHYNYYSQTLERYSNNIETLAGLFGYDKTGKTPKRTRIVKNKICTQQLDEMVKEMQIFYTILHLYLYGFQQYDNESLKQVLQWEPLHYFNANEKKISKILDEMYYHQLIRYMLGVIFIFTDNNYICPENGFRTLTVRARNSTINRNSFRYSYVSCSYIITCNCKGIEEPIPTPSNEDALKRAREYRGSPKFIKDSKEFKNYCEKLLNTDFSKEHTKKDLGALDTSVYHSNELMRGVIPQSMGLGTKIESMKNAQKAIDKFLNKYASD